MATINLDNLVKSLQAVTTAKQDQLTVSGYRNGMRMPPAPLSHPWRLVSPGLRTESEPLSRTAISATALMVVAAKRPERPTASRSGFPVTCRTSAAPFTAHPSSDRHDCLSNVCADVRANGLAGQRPGRGMAPAYSSGK